MPYPRMEVDYRHLKERRLPQRLASCAVHGLFPRCISTIQSLNGRLASEVPNGAAVSSLLLSCVTPQRRYTFLHSSHRIGRGRSASNPLTHPWVGGIRLSVFVNQDPAQALLYQDSYPGTRKLERLVSLPTTTASDSVGSGRCPTSRDRGRGPSPRLDSIPDSPPTSSAYGSNDLL
jgi:hypothetical protein